MLTNIKLTKNEAAILAAFPTFQFIADGGIETLRSPEGLVYASVWNWSFTEDAAAAAGISLRAVKGVISSLVKKGLATAENDLPADERTISLTEHGLAMVLAMHPEDEAEPTFTEPTPGIVLVQTPDDEPAATAEAEQSSEYASMSDDDLASTRSSYAARAKNNHAPILSLVALDTEIRGIDKEIERRARAEEDEATPSPDETTPEQPEVPLSGTFPVAWPESVGRIFWRALAKDGAGILATAQGLSRYSNESKGVLTITGDQEQASAMAAALPGLFTDANEHLKVWRKTSPNYKCHDLSTKEGRRDAWAVEQQFLRDFCRAVAGTFTQDMMAQDGVQAGLSYVTEGEEA